MTANCSTEESTSDRDKKPIKNLHKKYKRAKTLMDWPVLYMVFAAVAMVTGRCVVRATSRCQIFPCLHKDSLQKRSSRSFDSGNPFIGKCHKFQPGNPFRNPFMNPSTANIFWPVILSWIHPDVCPAKSERCIWLDEVWYIQLATCLHLSLQRKLNL